LFNGRGKREREREKKKKEGGSEEWRKWRRKGKFEGDEIEGNRSERGGK
jgi:hypothetical protein